MPLLYGHSTPVNNAIGPCWYCRHYAGPCWGDPDLADCRRDSRSRACVATASRGCVYFERVPGVDDDGWRPAPVVRTLRAPRAD